MLESSLIAIYRNILYYIECHTYFLRSILRKFGNFTEYRVATYKLAGNNEVTKCSYLHASDEIKTQPSKTKNIFTFRKYPFRSNTEI
jgi:hypothetical protein